MRVVALGASSRRQPLRIARRMVGGLSRIGPTRVSPRGPYAPSGPERLSTPRPPSVAQGLVAPSVVNDRDWEWT